MFGLHTRWSSTSSATTFTSRRTLSSLAMRLALEWHAWVLDDLAYNSSRPLRLACFDALPRPGTLGSIASTPRTPLFLEVLSHYRTLRQEHLERSPRSYFAISCCTCLAGFNGLSLEPRILHTHEPSQTNSSACSHIPASTL